jgi:hypothetical protein
MSSREEILRRAVESLMEDERLRSNLTDYEAEVVLNWANSWLEKKILSAPEEKAEEIASKEKERVRNLLISLNNMLLYSRSPTLSMAVGLVEKHLNEGVPFSTKEILEWVTELAGIIWERRGSGS